MRISDWSSDVCSSDLLKKAAALKDEAAAILAEYEKMRATAQASAHEALQKAQDEMKGEAERQGKALAAKLSQQTEEAEARLAPAKKPPVARLEGRVHEGDAAAPEERSGGQTRHEE